MTLLYDVIFLLFSVIYLPYLIFTGRWHRDFAQRFGIYPGTLTKGLDKKEAIWVHAVSVGEVMAARSLCEMLLEKYPAKKLIISTITRTGNNVAKRFFKDKATVIYLPLDISFIIGRIIKSIRPKIFIIVETEIWPNLITALHKYDVPVVLVNGRISPGSFRNYIKARPFIRPILDKITLFCMQNKEYKARIEEMGAPKDKVVVTGSMKFDTTLNTAMLNRDAMRSDMNISADEEVLIAASTHWPEEAMILRAYKELLKGHENLRLIIAPRHIERADKISALARRLSFTPVKTSNIARGSKCKCGRDVLILDTMGRLNQLFSIATIVFMGGSLMPKGGQNILEPAIFSKPIIFGPHMFNFKDIADTFLKSNAACMVKDESALFETINTLLDDPARREGLGRQAIELINKNKGVTSRNLELVSKYL